MNYRVECLTPTLIGDGSALSPIDYMVWKDQVNVLNQRRIFTLLARGPRLDSYLSQIKRDEKLEFATWGGFAQNYAERRIPFEDPAYSAYWQRLRAEYCHIPTFARTLAGPHVPGSALRGALRTACVAARASQGTLSAVEALMEGDRPARRPGEAADQHTLGRPTHDALKGFAIADSNPAPATTMKIHMLRIATLVEPRGGAGAKLALGWRTAPRGTVEARRVEDSTPIFAEMAVPGSAFEGEWAERSFFQDPEVARALGWRHPMTRDKVLDAANNHAGTLLDSHLEFANSAELGSLVESLENLRRRLEHARESGSACLINLGWGTGILNKVAFPKAGDEGFRNLLARSPHFSKAARSGLPFPKTRRIVFERNQPAALPGWILVELREPAA
jgi:CRISPR-associated protein Csm5